VQIELRANQNVPTVPQIPGTNQKQPVKPYRFITLQKRAVVIKKKKKKKRSHLVIGESALLIADYFD